VAAISVAKAPSDSPTRRIISLDSRSTTDIPIADLIIDGKLDIYPHVEEKGLLFLQFRRNMLTLAAGPYVGLIPLTPAVSVDVRPKLPIGNFARVLDSARGSLSSITGVDRLYLSENLASNSVLEFLAANLLDALRPVQEHGLLKDYVRISEMTSSPRGRINPSGTMARAWSKGQKHKVEAQYFEQTSNIPVNRVLKSALRMLLARMKSSGKYGRQLNSSVNRAYFDMPSGIGEMAPADFELAKYTLLSRTLPESRTYYSRPLEIALLIISNRGISLQEQGVDVLLETFIVNFETMFEDYLLRVLERRADPTILRVRSGNSSGKKPLFDDRKDPPAQPDIVITSIASGKKLIAEVKYKEKPTREDYNQAITYAVTYRSDRVILVHQNKPGAATGLRHIGTMNGIVLDAYAFDLSKADLDNEEQAFADVLLAAF
jgi:5-methylcytosine-specific restriction enzyme subunit McrC